MPAILDRVDEYQQRHRWLSLPFAVYKKFGDDQAGNLAALISYYLFFSIFPLLLALVTILGYVLAGNQHLQTEVTNSALGSFPLIGKGNSVHALSGNWFGLVVGLGLALWSGLAVAQQAQNAFNTVWAVPRVERPGFAPRLLRSLELVVVVGFGLMITTAVQTTLSGSKVYGLNFGYGTVILGLVVGVVLNVGVLLVAFKRGTALELSWRQLLPGAVTGGVVWTVLQKLGAHLVNSKVSGASSTYGTFAVVIGLLSYFYILAQATLYCAEVNVVLAHGLWPRGLRTLAGTATTEADERAYRAYPQKERQVHETDIDVDVTNVPDGPAPSPKGSAFARKPASGSGGRDGAVRGAEPDADTAAAPAESQPVARVPLSVAVLVGASAVALAAGIRKLD